MTLVDNRTGIEVLDRDACLRLLHDHEHGVGRIAVNDGSHPVILPVNYIMWAQHIAFRTAAGTKFGNALRGAHVAFEIDHFDDETHSGWSVLVKGRSETASPSDRKSLAALPLQPWSEHDKPEWVLVHAEIVTGRRVG